MARFHLHSIILPYVSKLPVLVGVQAAHVNSARVSGGGVHQAPKARQKFAEEKNVIICNLGDIRSHLGIYFKWGCALTCNVLNRTGSKILPSRHSPGQVQHRAHQPGRS